MVLAAFIGSVGLVRNHDPAEMVALGGGLVLVVVVSRRMSLIGVGRRLASPATTTFLGTQRAA